MSDIKNTKLFNKSSYISLVVSGYYRHGTDCTKHFTKTWTVRDFVVTHHIP